MNTKSKTLLWLFDKAPPLFTSPGNHGFIGSLPPTGEQVILQFFGYHNYLQEVTKLQSSRDDAIRLCVTDVENWWSKTGIVLKSWQAIQTMIKKQLAEFKLRKAKQKVNTASEQQKVNRQAFKMISNCTFWVVQPEFEEKLKLSEKKEKKDGRDLEDWLYLEGVRGAIRTATLGGRDQKLKERKKRRMADEKSEKERGEKEKLRLQKPNSAVQYSSSDESNDGDFCEISSSSSRPKSKVKKVDSITTDACLIADKYGISNRAMTELAAAFHKSNEGTLNNVNLSVNTIRRRRQNARQQESGKILASQLHSHDGVTYALHWDGKIIKSLTHTGDDKDRVAVILTGTDGQEILLSIVEIEGKSTAANEAAQIFQIIEEYDINIQKISALVFDTTSVNTGVNKGIIRKLEDNFGRQLLQLACRHHIHELVVGAPCSSVFGPTTSPSESIFKVLVKKWNELNKGDYTMIEILSCQRELSRLIDETVVFLQDWMANSTKNSLRHDYLELATITLLYLGGTVPENWGAVAIRPPGAFHHARWMSKTLYTIKIALFRHQLSDTFPEEQLQSITSLASYLSIFYTKTWLTSTSAADAPLNDLRLIKKLAQVKQSVDNNRDRWPDNFFSFVNAAQEKLNSHLWYLSERLVPMALFSSNADVGELSSMRRSMLKFESTANNEMDKSMQQMPASFNMKNKQLKDFVGNDSWRIFSLLEIDPSFLKLPVSNWPTTETYLKAKEIVRNLPVVNDAAERALGLATDFNTKTTPKSEKQLQALYKVVKGCRVKLQQLATSTEVVTKKLLESVQYSWS